MYTKTITVDINEEEIEVEVSFEIEAGEQQTHWEPGYPPEIVDFGIENYKDLLDYNIILIEQEIQEYINNNESKIIEEYKNYYEDEAAEYLYEQRKYR